MRRLRAQPVTVRQPEESTQAKIGIGRHRALSRDDVADPLRRHADLLGEPVLRDAHRLEELLQKELAGCYGLEFAHTVRPLSDSPRSRRRMRSPRTIGNKCAIAR